MPRKKKTTTNPATSEPTSGIFADQSNDPVNKEKQKQAIKSINSHIKNFSDFQKGFGVFANSQVSVNKKLAGKMDENTELLKSYSDQSKALLKIMGTLAKNNNNLVSGKQPKDAKEKKKNTNFEDKARVEREILGEDDLVLSRLKSINDDTTAILKIMQQAAKAPKPRPTTDDSGGLGSLLSGGILTSAIAAGVAAALGAASPNAASGARAAINVLPTAARAVAPIAEAGRGVAAAAKGIRSFSGTTGIGAAAKAALASIKGIPSGYSAKDFLVGEQKIGKLGALGAAAGAGATYGRYAEGDTTGAILQGLSTALPLALSKTKFGKIATLGSAATDVGLLVRDYFKTDEDKAKEKAVVESRKTDEEKAAALAATATNDPAVKIADNTNTTNTLLTDIKNYFVGGGKIGTSSNGVMAASGGGGALMMGGLATLGIAGAVLSRGKLGGIFPRITTPVGAAAGAASGAVGGAARTGAGRAPLVRPVGAISGAAQGVAGAASGLGKFGSIAKLGAKMGGKAIPLVGLGLGAMGAYDKLKQGDGLGAVLEFGAGAASLIPVVGTAASIALTGVSAARDTANQGGSTGDALMTGGLSAAMMAGTYGIAGGVGKLLKGNADNAIGAVGKNVTDASKSLAGSADDAVKGVAKGAKDTQAEITKSSSLLAKAGESLKVNVESMFKNVNGTLLGTIAKFSTIGIVGAAVGAATGIFGKTDAQRLQSKLGTGDITGVQLGGVSAAFESGNRGVSTISTGKGDKGGVSYGKHQMTAATMKNFLNSTYGARYKNELSGAIGSAQFNEHYKRIASVDGANFEAQQKKFIDVNYFGVAANLIKKGTGFDVLKRGRALQELIYSSAVQYGPQGVASWFTSGAVLGKNPASLSDEQIITKIQDYKASNVNRHFKNSSADVQQGVANRISTEKQMLLNINAKNGGTGAGLQTSSLPTSKKGTVAATGKSAAGATNPSVGADEGTKSGAINNAEYLKLGMQNVTISKGVNMAGLNPTMRNQFYTMVGELFATKKPRAKVIVTSAFRTREQQEVLWKQKGQDTSKVARPGTSRHEKGYAIDIDNKSTGNGDLLESSGLLRKYGFSRPLKNEPWHIEYGNSGGVTAGDDNNSVSAAVGAMGVEEGGELTPDQEVSQSASLISQAIAAGLNSEAMDAVREFMKGDIYKTGDKTPFPKAAGSFTTDKDEADPNRKLDEHSRSNGEAQDLSGVLGGDDIKRLQRSSDYEKTRSAMQGTNKIERLERPDNYEETRAAMQGDSKIKRLMGGLTGKLGNNKYSWIYDLLNGLGFGGGVLGEVLQVATGQKSVKDIDLNKVIPIQNQSLGMSQGAVNGGIAGGINSTATNIDNSNVDSNDISTYNTGMVTPSYTNAEGEFIGMGQTESDNTKMSGATMDEHGFTPQLNGGILGKVGSVLGNGIDGIGGLASVVGAISNGSFDKKSLMTNVAAAAIDSGIGYFGKKVSYDESNKQYEDMEMNQAKRSMDEEKKRNNEVTVNIPPTTQPSNDSGGSRGRKAQSGLEGQILVKNPDTIPHAVAVSLMKHSI